MPFQSGMKMFATSPDIPANIFELLLTEMADGKNDTFNMIQEKGSTVLDYIKQNNASYIKATCFETKIDGLKCLAVNKALTNSQLFESVWDNTKYDAMITFYWHKSFWTVLLYTDKECVDVSVIAKKHGGGGHKQAAGFQCGELPFNMIDNNPI